MTSDELRDSLREHEGPYRSMALERLKAAPDAVSEYDRYLLGDDFERERAIVLRAKAEREAAAAAVQRRRNELTAALRPAEIVFRNAHLERLNADVIETALRHNIRVRPVAMGQGAFAYSSERLIACPPVTNEFTYAVALHEIGHLVSPDGDSSQYRYVVAEKSCVAIGGEVGAWRWAVAHAGNNWSTEMQGRLYDAMKDYATFANSNDERLEIAELIHWASRRVTDRPVDPERLRKQLFAIYEAA
jgi:hypothetical protein